MFYPIFSPPNINLFFSVILLQDQAYLYSLTYTTVLGGHRLPYATSSLEDDREPQ